MDHTLHSRGFLGAEGSLNDWLGNHHITNVTVTDSGPV